MAKNKLHLRVTVNPASGFCHGVINAIQKAEKALEKEETIYCVGQIVHNDMEVKRLEAMGLKTISHEELRSIKNSVVLFRAHGESPESYAIAKENGNKIVDASCKVVLKLQDRIRQSAENGEHIYIFGKRNHPEVLALIANTKNKAIVFEAIEELDLLHIPDKITLYSQTTKSLSRFYKVAEFLEKNGIHVNLKDTVCRQVHNREKKLEKFCRNNQKNIFVAGKDSSNGKVLFNICKNANEQSFFASNASEIMKEWFVPNEKVGISGATSTPLWQMEEIKQLLESW